MTIDMKWLEEHCNQIRCCLTEQQQTYVLTLFGKEPDEYHCWSKQDICEQIRKITEQSNFTSSSIKVVKYE